MSDEPTQPFLSIAEASRRLGFTSESTAYKLIKEDKFPVPVVKVGKVLKVRAAQLDAFISGDAA